MEKSQGGLCSPLGGRALRGRVLVFFTSKKLVDSSNCTASFLETEAEMFIFTERFKKVFILLQKQCTLIV